MEMESVENVTKTENTKNAEAQVQVGTGFAQINDQNRFEFMSMFYAIEVVFLKHYRADRKLKDKDVILSLKRLRDNLHTPKFKFSQMERDVLNNIYKEVAAVPYSDRDVLMCLMRILNAVKRIHEKDGTRGYLEYLDANVKIMD